MRTLLLLAFFAAGNAAADQAAVAVAANFSVPARQLAERFEQASGHKLTLSSGSTGKFYAQIASGAPFDILLSADSETPQRLEREKLAAAGSRFTYAVGKLALWSARPGLVDDQGEVLRSGGFARLAIANPKLAPYGAAAQQTLEKLGLWTTLQDKLVQGENIAQTLQFVATGNAELGFIAFSQIQEGGRITAGSYWLVPSHLHAPLQQDAALLSRGANNPAARRFLEFLRSAGAREVIRGYGYEVP
jgi:molybdate transport system substrate-binding protein